jgi:antitoxin VapB
MPLNIKNGGVEQLVDEVARLTGESKTEVIRKAVAERRARLVLEVVPGDRTAELTRFLEREVWSLVPPDLLGTGISQAEQDAILGYGSEGV